MKALEQEFLDRVLDLTEGYGAPEKEIERLAGLIFKGLVSTGNILKIDRTGLKPVFTHHRPKI